MKKIFSFVFILGAVALVSCGGNRNKSAETVEVVSTETVAEVECDSTACCGKCDSTACDKAEGTCCGSENCCEK